MGKLRHRQGNWLVQRWITETWTPDFYILQLPNLLVKVEGTSVYLSQNPRTSLLMVVESTPKHRRWEIMTFPSVRYFWNCASNFVTLKKREIHSPLYICHRAPIWTHKILCNNSRLWYLYSAPHTQARFTPQILFWSWDGSKTTIITPTLQSPKLRQKQACLCPRGSGRVHPSSLNGFAQPLSRWTWNPASHQDESYYVGLPSSLYGSRHFCHLHVIVK